MTIIFEATDPRGYKVILTEDVLNNHILPSHPDMKGREQDIKNTIEHPVLNYIYADAKHGNRNVYYWLDRPRNTYLKVIVEFMPNNTGAVITAFQTSAPKRGEQLLWPD